MTFGLSSTTCCGILRRQEDKADSMLATEGNPMLVTRYVEYFI